MPKFSSESSHSIMRQKPLAMESQDSRVIVSDSMLSEYLRLGSGAWVWNDEGTAMVYLSIDQIIERSKERMGR